MSQSQCGGSSSQTRYRSSPWWAFTPPTSLIGHRPLREREARRSPALLFRVHAVLASLSAGYPPLPGTFRCITHPFATRRHPEGPAAVRLACVRHAASVQSEPGSNSQVQSKNLARILRCACQRSTPRQHPHRSAVPKFLKNLPFPPHRLGSAAEPALFLTPSPLSIPSKPAPSYCLDPAPPGLPTASLTRFQRQQRERGRIVGKGGEKGKQEILIHPITKRKRHPERCRHQSSCAIAPSRTGRWTQAQSATLSATSANSGI